MNGADLSTLDVVVRVVVGALLGAVVGIERESAGQEAGFRTHLLLAMGAALFGVASVGAFDSFVTERAATNVQIDVTRIASYVAAGIGFIGGGVIVKHQGNVRGMTTAASVWVAAAIGLSAGLGFWAGAVSATLVALVALYALKPISHRIRARSEQPELVVSLSPTAAPSTSDISTVVEACGSNRVRSIDIEPPLDGEPTRIVLTFPEEPPDGIVERVAGRLFETLGDRLQSVRLRSPADHSGASGGGRV